MAVTDLAEMQRQYLELKSNGTSDHVMEPPPPAPSRQTPMLDDDALFGLAGDLVRAIEPYSAAHRAGLLFTFMVAFGAMVNRGPHVWVGEVPHRANEFILQVGKTSKARKGTTLATINRILEAVDSVFARERVISGLVSGEGLIWAIRDPIAKAGKDGQPAMADEGVTDKRLLAIEPEYAAVLAAIKRQGNRLSTTLRECWDSPAILQSASKFSPGKATSPHISMVAHITENELLDNIGANDATNGLLNRYLIIWTTRSKLLPRPPRIPVPIVNELVRRTNEAYRFAINVGEVVWGDEAGAMWDDIYSEVSQERDGLLDALTARSEAHVIRLSLLYALLDSSPEIRTPHLTAALAAWRYVEQSMLYVFGDATGNPIADRVLAALRNSGPMTRRDLFDLFGRNVNAAQLDRAMEVLIGSGKVLASQAKGDGPGRPSTVYAARNAPDQQRRGNGAERSIGDRLRSYGSAGRRGEAIEAMARETAADLRATGEDAIEEFRRGLDANAATLSDDELRAGKLALQLIEWGQA